MLLIMVVISDNVQPVFIRASTTPWTLVFKGWERIQRSNAEMRRLGATRGISDGALLCVDCSVHCRFLASLPLPTKCW